MADAEDTIQTLRRLVIDTKDELMHARYRLNGLDLILESLADERAMSASQEIFGLADEKLNVVDDKLDQLYRQLSALERGAEWREYETRMRGRWKLDNRWLRSSEHKVPGQTST